MYLTKSATNSQLTEKNYKFFFNSKQFISIWAFNMNSWLFLNFPNDAVNLLNNMQQ